MGRITFFILVYLSTCVGIHMVTNLPATCTIDDRSSIQVNDAQQVLAHSDQFDSQCIFLEGQVMAAGHWFFDLFWVNTYTLKCKGGCVIVFGSDTTPMRNSVVSVSGEFRQFYHGHYFSWVGMVEAQRFYRNQ